MDEFKKEDINVLLDDFLDRFARVMAAWGEEDIPLFGREMMDLVTAMDVGHLHLARLVGHGLGGDSQPGAQSQWAQIIEDNPIARAFHTHYLLIVQAARQAQLDSWKNLHPTPNQEDSP